MRSLGIGKSTEGSRSLGVDINTLNGFFGSWGRSVGADTGLTVPDANHHHG